MSSDNTYLLTSPLVQVHVVPHPMQADHVERYLSITTL